MVVELSASFWHFLHTFIENFWVGRVKQISRDLVGSCRRHNVVCPAPQVDFCTSRFYNNDRRAFYIFLALFAHMHIRHHTCIMHRKMQNDAICRNVLERKLLMSKKNINTPPFQASPGWFCIWSICFAASPISHTHSIERRRQNIKLSVMLISS